MLRSELVFVLIAIFLTFPVLADGFDDLVGEWVSLDEPSHETIVVTRDTFSHRGKLWRKDGGGGNLLPTKEQQGDVRLLSKDRTCIYSIGFSDNMNFAFWTLVSGEQSLCISGRFARTQTLEGRSTLYSAADAGQGHDIYKKPDGVPASGLYAINIKCKDSSDINLGEAFFRNGISGFGFVNTAGEFSIAHLRFSFNDLESKAGKLDGQILEPNEITDLHFSSVTSDASNAFNGRGRMRGKEDCNVVITQK
jgi:hypothetical protein